MGTANPQTLTLKTSTSVIAAFVQTSFPVTITTNGPGTVAVSSNTSANNEMHEIISEKDKNICPLPSCLRVHPNGGKDVAEHVINGIQ